MSQIYIRGMEYGEVPKDFSAIFFCPGCKAGYLDKAVAIKCSESNEKPTCKVGDLVLISLGYMWFDGDERWLVKNQIEKGEIKPTYSAYFVVTAINHDERHRIRYSVKTLGIKNGNQTGLCGWTSGSHKPGKKVDLSESDRAKMIDETKQFIGETYDHLL